MHCLAHVASMCSTSWKAGHVIGVEPAKYVSFSIVCRPLKKKDHFQTLVDLINADITIPIL